PELGQFEPAEDGELAGDLDGDQAGGPAPALDQPDPREPGGGGAPGLPTVEGAEPVAAATAAGLAELDQVESGAIAAVNQAFLEQSQALDATAEAQETRVAGIERQARQRVQGSVAAAIGTLQAKGASHRAALQTAETEQSAAAEAAVSSAVDQANS